MNSEEFIELIKKADPSGKAIVLMQDIAGDYQDLDGYYLEEVVDVNPSAIRASCRSYLPINRKTEKGDLDAIVIS